MKHSLSTLLSVFIVLNFEAYKLSRIIRELLRYEPNLPVSRPGYQISRMQIDCSQPLYIFSTLKKRARGDGGRGNEKREGLSTGTTTTTTTLFFSFLVPIPSRPRARSHSHLASKNREAVNSLQHTEENAQNMFYAYFCRFWRDVWCFSTFFGEIGEAFQFWSPIFCRQ